MEKKCPFILHSCTINIISVPTGLTVLTPFGFSSPKVQLRMQTVLIGFQHLSFYDFFFKFLKYECHLNTNLNFRPGC